MFVGNTWSVAWPFASSECSWAGCCITCFRLIKSQARLQLFLRFPLKKCTCDPRAVMQNVSNESETKGIWRFWDWCIINEQRFLWMNFSAFVIHLSKQIFIFIQLRLHYSSEKVPRVVYLWRLYDDADIIIIDHRTVHKKLSCPVDLKCTWKYSKWTSEVINVAVTARRGSNLE